MVPTEKYIPYGAIRQKTYTFKLLAYWSIRLDLVKGQNLVKREVPVPNIYLSN